jgi:hypothetical protein
VLVLVLAVTMLDHHNLFVMPVHVFVVITILLDDNLGIFRLCRQDKRQCNSKGRESGEGDN